MHRSAVTNAAVLHHQDGDVDLHYCYNAFVSLFSVSGLSSFKEHIFQRGGYAFLLVEAIAFVDSVVFKDMCRSSILK